MQSKKSIIYFSVGSILLVSMCATAQTMNENILESNEDFSAVEAYFVLADRLKENKEPSEVEWDSFFQSPINSMMISSGAMDVIRFKNNLRQVYSTSGGIEFDPTNEELIHHTKYKVNEKNLKNHIIFLKTSSVTDSILKYLCPYLPGRLCLKQNVPKQYYIFYGSEDATGGPGMVINDLYLSYKIDSYRLGLLSAHETFHSIVTKAFSEMIKPAEKGNDHNIELLYFLSNISQEGVADLIDKNILSNAKSPLKQKVETLKSDELSLTIECISKLDSLLEKSGRDGDFKLNFNTLFTDYSKNGGHIPGRLMGLAIKNSGLLSELLPAIEDPILFFEIYNKAVSKNKLNMPSFSKPALTYLHKVKSEYYKSK